MGEANATESQSIIKNIAKRCQDDGLDNTKSTAKERIMPLMLYHRQSVKDN